MKEQMTYVSLDESNVWSRLSTDSLRLMSNGSSPSSAVRFWILVRSSLTTGITSPAVMKSVSNMSAVSLNGMRTATNLISTFTSDLQVECILYLKRNLYYGL